MKTIKINDSTHTMLLVMKVQNNYKTIDEVINRLLDDEVELNQKQTMTVAEYREELRRLKLNDK